MVANNKEYMRSYMKEYYKKNPEKYSANKRLGVLKRASKSGRKPRDSTMTKYKITNEEIMKAIGDNWFKTSWEPKPKEDPEKIRMRRQIRELKNLLM